MILRRSTTVLTVAIVLAALSPHAHAQNETPKKYALLIGLNQYLSPRVPDLKYATKDVADLLPLLRENGYTPIGPLVDMHAGRDNVVAHLYRIATLAKPQDTFLLYFAGHGVRSTLGRSPTYWLTYDATFEKLDVDGIRLNHLLDYVADIRAGQKIVILDHCFSGDVVVRPAAPGDPSRDATSGPTLDLVPVERGGTPLPSVENLAETAGAGTIIIAAARGFAYEIDSSSGGNGILTTALLQALKTRSADTNSDTKLSVTELTNYLESEVWRLSNQTQRPQISLTQAVNLNSWIFADKLKLDDSEAKVKATAYMDTLMDLHLRQHLAYPVIVAANSMLDAWVKSFSGGRQLTTTESTAVRSFETLMADITLPEEQRASFAQSLINAFHRRQ